MRDIDKKLFLAIEEKNLDQVKLAVACGADVHAVLDVLDMKTLHLEHSTRTCHGYKVIHFAVARGTPEIINYLIKNGLQPNEINYKSVNSPLHIAAWRGMTNNVKELLKHKVDFNIRNRWGLTALHEAVKFNNIEVIKLLIDAGCDDTIKDNYGYTPIELAKKLKHVQAVEVLSIRKKERIRGRESALKPDLYINESQNAVAIVRLLESKNEEHAFLIIETLENIKRIDLFVDNTTPKKSMIRVKDHFLDSNASKVTALKILIRAFGQVPVNKSCYLAWNISKQETDTLKKDIMEDQRNPPEYHVSGNRAVIVSSDGRKPHNCFTWAREKLRNLGNDEINNDLDLKPTDWIAAKTSFYLPNPNMFWYKRPEVIASSVISVATGVGVGYFIKSRM